METETELRKLKDCAHCRVNPEGKKPFIKMTRLSIQNHVYADLQETAKNHQQRPECFICEGVTEFIEALEQQHKD